MRECVVAITFYIGLAVLFGIGVLVFAGGEYAGEFYAGWLTEYSLSIDNLFVFVIIMARFAGTTAVPADRTARRDHPGAGDARHLHRPRRRRDPELQLDLLPLRRLPRLHGGEARHPGRVATTTTSRRTGCSSGSSDASRPRRSGTACKLTARVDGKKVITPMLVVILALGTTDLLFALDSIPAIYGLTKEPYLVFTANVFALMGLRQLYFLHRRPARAAGLPQPRPLGRPRLHRRQAGPARRCTRTSCRSSTAASTSESRRSRSGSPCVVILGVLAITTVASLLKVRRDPEATDGSGRI